MQADLDKADAAMANKDYLAAYRLWKPYAEAGNASLQFNIGNLYWNGHGVEKSVTEGIHWHTLAANQNYIKSQLLLMHAYEAGIGVPKSDKLSADWCLKAAQNGSVEAEVRMGYLYILGQGVPKSESDALMWLKKAAKKNHPEAIQALKEAGVEP